MHLIESVINGFECVAKKKMLRGNFNDKYPDRECSFSSLLSRNQLTLRKKNKLEIRFIVNCVSIMAISSLELDIYVLI